MENLTEKMNKENLVHQINEINRERLRINEKLDELYKRYEDNFAEFKVGDLVYYKYFWEDDFSRNKRGKIVSVRAKVENKHSSDDQKIIVSYHISPMTKKWEEHKGQNIFVIKHGRTSYNGSQDLLKLAEDVDF